MVLKEMIIEEMINERNNHEDNTVLL